MIRKEILKYLDHVFLEYFLMITSVFKLSKINLRQ